MKLHTSGGGAYLGNVIGHLPLTFLAGESGY